MSEETKESYHSKKKRYAKVKFAIFVTTNISYLWYPTWLIQLWWELDRNPPDTDKSHRRPVEPYRAPVDRDFHLLGKRLSSPESFHRTNVELRHEIGHACHNWRTFWTWSTFFSFFFFNTKKSLLTCRWEPWSRFGRRGPIGPCRWWWAVWCCMGGSPSFLGRHQSSESFLEQGTEWLRFQFGSFRV